MSLWEKNKDDMANALVFISQNWVDFEKNPAGKPVGFWLAKEPPGDRHNFLKMALGGLTAMKKGDFDEEKSVQLYQGHYRLVVNTRDNRGGYFVVIGNDPDPTASTPSAGAQTSGKKWWEFWKKSPAAFSATTAVEKDVLTCPRCQAKYHVGRDAIIITAEDILGLGAVTVALSPAEDYAQSPQLVGKLSPDPSPESIDKAKLSLSRVRNDLKAGKPRTWYCEKCNNSASPYEYPASFIS